ISESRRLPRPASRGRRNPVKKAPATGCTIAHAATFSQAVVLAKSFREFHPQGHFTILLVDDASERLRLPNISVLGLGDVVEPGEECRLPMLWSNDELTDLLQPALLLALLHRGAAIAAYFASSTQIFDSIDDILEFARGAECPCGSLTFAVTIPTSRICSASIRVCNHAFC